MYRLDSVTRLYKTHQTQRARAALCDALIVGCVVSFVLMLLLATALARSAAAAESDTPAGLFFRTDSGNAVIEAPGLASEVTMAVSGMVNRVALRQVFHNPTDRWMEGIYIFPLPERSAVDRLAMTIGERQVTGRIMEKSEAEAAYREAVAQGRRASLLSGKRPNVFVTSVANIAPGEIVVIEIGYQDAVAYDNGVFSLRFPMVVAPRYTPAAPAAAETPAAAQPVRLESQTADLFGPLEADGRAINAISVDVTLDAGLPLKSVESLYHLVVIETLDGGQQRITLSDDGTSANRDFVLEWQPKVGTASEAAIFAEQIDNDSHLMITLLPPDPAAESGATSEPDPVRLPRELIFVVDTSGSMHGDSLDQAKGAVNAALKRLAPEDRFNVIRFSDRTHALFDTAVPADTENVGKAWYYVRALQAEGGTEMAPALDLALGNARHSGYLRQVVFITDGAVSNEQALFQQVSSRLGESRLFTVGIGAAPNSYFMRKSAELGRGSFTYIGDLSEVATRMDALLRKLEKPALTQLRIDWPMALRDATESYPSPLPDLYAGEPVSFSVRFADTRLEDLAGIATVTGEGPDGVWQRSLSLDGLATSPGAAALWARAKLAQIENGLYVRQDRAAVRAEALALALRYGLVTPHTSLVAIDKAVARPEGAPMTQRDLPRSLPEGWSAEHVLGRPAADMAPDGLQLRELPAELLQRAAAGPGQPVVLPQGATPATWMLILGLAALLLGGVLLLLLRRGSPSHA